MPHCADSGGSAGRGLLLAPVDGLLSLRKSEARWCAGSTFSRCAMERLRSLVEAEAVIGVDLLGGVGASRAL